MFCTSVTEEWANATLVGWASRDVLTRLAPDLALDSAAFPHMTMREADLGGIPARIFRVSFSGELSYEINVPADQGLELWERLMAVGEPLGITPYGTEAMHVHARREGLHHRRPGNRRLGDAGRSRARRARRRETRIFSAGGRWRAATPPAATASSWSGCSPTIPAR